MKKTIILVFLILLVLLITYFVSESVNRRAYIRGIDFLVAEQNEKLMYLAGLLDGITMAFESPETLKVGLDKRKFWVNDLIEDMELFQIIEILDEYLNVHQERLPQPCNYVFMNCMFDLLIRKMKK